MKMTPNERLKQLRLEMGMSQRSFGKALGLQQGSYSDIERGKANVSPAVLAKLDQMGFNTRYFMEGLGNIRKDTTESIKSRIISAIDSLGYRADMYGLAQKTGIDLGRLSFMNSPEEPDSAFIDDFLRIFPQLNREWLLSSKGTMFISSSHLDELLKKEIIMLRELIAEKDKTIEDKNQMITNLYRQIDLLSSFIPSRDK